MSKDDQAKPVTQEELNQWKKLKPANGCMSPTCADAWPRLIAEVEDWRRIVGARPHQPRMPSPGELDGYYRCGHPAGADWILWAREEIERLKKDRDIWHGATLQMYQLAFDVDPPFADSIYDRAKAEAEAE